MCVNRTRETDPEAENGVDDVASVEGDVLHARAHVVVHVLLNLRLALAGRWGASAAQTRMAKHP
jgi:hypothetical protein